MYYNTYCVLTGKKEKAKLIGDVQEEHQQSEGETEDLEEKKTEVHISGVSLQIVGKTYKL